MKLFYVMGGGMGHLHRVAVFIRQFKIEQYSILSANPQVYHFFPEAQVIFISPTFYEEAWQAFIKEKLPTLQVEAFYVDSFPNGLIGELLHWPTPDYPVFYLARRLKWDNYKRNLQGIKFEFEGVFQLEELEAEQLDFVQTRAKQIFPLLLNYPPPVSIVPTDFGVPSNKPLWLIVHAFDEEEVEMLLHYASDAAQAEGCDPYFLLLSDCKHDVINGSCMRYFPAADWFPLADRIFSGAGFNTAQQIKPFLNKTTLIPFPRNYDDQVWRANRLALSKY